MYISNKNWCHILSFPLFFLLEEGHTAWQNMANIWFGKWKEKQPHSVPRVFFLGIQNFILLKDICLKTIDGRKLNAVHGM
jgi:hypothetical protein